MSFIVNFSTWLTLLRIGLTPCVMMAIYSHMWLQAIIVLVVASSTDFLDGYYARLYNQETELGKILDPVADKVLTLGALWSLYYVVDQSCIPAWFLIVLVCKDLVLLFVGTLLLIKKGDIISPSYVSKYSTALLIVLMVYILLLHAGFWFYDFVGIFIFFYALLIAFIVCDYGYKIYKQW